MAKPTWAGNGRNEDKEKFHPLWDRLWQVPWNEDGEMRMGKPSWAGIGRNEGKEKFNSALDRSWEVSWDEDEGTVFDNLGRVEGVKFTDSNDFFYLAADQGWDYEAGTVEESEEEPDGEPNGELDGGPDDDTNVEPVDDTLIIPKIDGLGGADHLILQEEATVFDGFFADIQNITVLKLFGAKGAEEDFEFEGSQVTLGEAAQSAGIREVTGGPGDDVINFSGYVLESESNDEPENDEPEGDVLENDDPEDEVADTLEIIIKGGAGADEMTASVGNDTFIWKAGDMEGTNEDHAEFGVEGHEGNLIDVIINFNTDGEDVLDISDMLIGFDCTFGEAETDQERLDYLTDWIVFEDETLSVDIDGAGDVYESETLVLLQGVAEINPLADLLIC